MRCNSTPPGWGLTAWFGACRHFRTAAEIARRYGCCFASLLFLSFADQAALAQTYTLRYTTMASGAVTFTGSSLGRSKLFNQNGPGQLDSIGGFITLDKTSRLGSYPSGTTLNWSNNSSAAAGASLIWQGPVNGSFSIEATPSLTIVSWQILARFDH